MKLDCLFLIKYGEIALKGGNRKFFLNKLKTNIKCQLKNIPNKIIIKWGRIYLYIDSENKEFAEKTLGNVLGIISYSFAYRIPKDINEIKKHALRLAREKEGHNFKIDARRQDKTFPHNSYEIACILGEEILKNIPDLKVNLYYPDWIINIEIREQAYLYSSEKNGPGGLPAGCSGKGLLLLSGGIDSPAAGYLMARRGLSVSSIYFHTYPYTSDKALDKVKTLHETLGNFIPKSALHIIDFTKIQLEIKSQANPDEITLLSRACMMRIASLIAHKNNYSCLITGESLGQVASQTIESLSFTNSQTEFTVIRPLIGMDKEEIITIAKRIGTYEISILPFADCCTIFAPEHPLIRPELKQITESFNKLQLGDMLLKASENAEVLHL
jgi:tRNA uracil 4-sulfurtransferase